MGGRWSVPPALPLPWCPKLQLPSTVARSQPGRRTFPARAPSPGIPVRRALHSSTCPPASGNPTRPARIPSEPLGPHPAQLPSGTRAGSARGPPEAGKGLPAPPAPATPARRPAGATPPHLGAHVRHEGGLRRLGAAATADYPFPQHTASLGSSNAREQRRPLAAATNTGGRGSAHPQGRGGRGAARIRLRRRHRSPRPGPPGPHLLHAWASAAGNPPPEATPPPLATVGSDWRIVAFR